MGKNPYVARQLSVRGEFTASTNARCLITKIIDIIIGMIMRFPTASLLPLACVIALVSGCSETLDMFTKKNAKEAAVTKSTKKTPVTTQSPGVGSLAGLGIVHSTGLVLDNIDREYIMRTSQEALNITQTGKSIRWRNPDSGNHGSIKAVTEIKHEGSKDCRKYAQTVTIEGKTRNYAGKACRQADGTWLNSL